MTSSGMLTQDVLGRFALPILADYVATAGLSAQAQVSRSTGADYGHDISLSSRTAAPLRQSACALYGVCKPSQVTPKLATQRFSENLSVCREHMLDVSNFSLILDF